MDQRFFLQPFAVSGDRDSIPTAVQPSGTVSYAQGFGVDYELNLATEPTAKPIPRGSTNGLFYDVTFALGDLQRNGTPEFITTADNGGSPYAYAKGALVRWRASGGDPFRVYVSRQDGNTALPSDATKWDPFPEPASNSEATTGTSTTKFISPATLTYVLSSVSVTVPAASFTVSGISRYATQAEIQTGVVDAAMTPAPFRQALLTFLIPPATATTVGRSRFATGPEAAGFALDTVGITPATLGTAIPAASTTQVGRSRFATLVEAQGNALDTVGVTPAGLVDRARFGQNANFAAVSATSYNKTSSRELKELDGECPYGLAEVLALETGIGRYIPGVVPGVNHTQLFLIAEQAEGWIPEVVDPEGATFDGHAYPTLDYTQVVPVLVRALQQENRARRTWQAVSITLGLAALVLHFVGG